LAKFKLSDLIVWGSALVVGSWIYRQVKGPRAETAAVQPPAQAPLPAPAAPQPYSDYLVVLPATQEAIKGTVITAQPPPPSPPPTTPTTTTTTTPAATTAAQVINDQERFRLAQVLGAFRNDLASCPTSMAGRAPNYLASAMVKDTTGIAFYSDQIACMQAKGWQITYDYTDVMGLQHYVVSR